MQTKLLSKTSQFWSSGLQFKYQQQLTVAALHQGNGLGRNTTALAADLSVKSGSNKIIHQDILTALAGVTNDLHVYALPWAVDWRRHWQLISLSSMKQLLLLIIRFMLIDCSLALKTAILMIIIVRLQINTFLNRLCGEPIGFTVLRIFVIDRNTILTVSNIPTY